MKRGAARARVDGSAPAPAAPAEAALVWTAAAAARMWTAAAHNLAAWNSCRNASEAMAEAAEAGRNAAAAAGEAVGKDSRVNSVALENAAAALNAAVLAHRRASAGFAKAAARARSSAAEWDTAADVLAMVGDAGGGKLFRGLAGKAREMAQDADGRAASAAAGKRAAQLASDNWKENAAGWAAGGAWSGDRSEWVGMHESIRADAEYDRAVWSGAAERAAEAVRDAVEYVRECAAAAKDVAAAAREVHVRASTPGARDAMEAWNEAMAAVRKAPDASRPRA